MSSTRGKRTRWSLLLVVALAGPALGQRPATPDVAVGALKTRWQLGHDNIVRAAIQVPEALYSFKPVFSVRTFGQLLGHVAGSEYEFCAAALGEAPRAEHNIERTKKTKTELIAALRAAGQYCARAHQQSDAAAADMTKVFGRDQTRMTALTINATHVWEHYGNVVTYMRMRGFVPPSSQP